MTTPYESEAVVMVTAEDIKAVPNPSLVFLRWIHESLTAGRLPIFIQAAIQAGQATDARSALIYLNELIKNFSVSQLRVGVKDLRGPSSGYRFGELKELVIGETSSVRDPSRIFGMQSHKFASTLFTGEITTRRRKKIIVRDAHQITLTGLQLEDSCNGINVDEGENYSLFPELTDKNDLTEGVEQWGIRDISKLLRRIEKIWKFFLEKNPNLWQLHRKQLDKLKEALTLLCRKNVMDLRAKAKSSDEELIVLTLLSWASAIAYYREQKRDKILFKEVPVISSRRTLGGGRVDAIEILSINGKVPTRSQCKILEGMAKHQYRSMGQLIQALNHQFGRKFFGIKVYDWKFLVGDILPYYSKSSLPDLSRGPLSEHREQMQRYLTLIHFGYHLRTHSDTIWGKHNFDLVGEICYFLPYSRPVIHQIRMTAEEQKEFFESRIARRWPKATQNAMIRLYNNLFLGKLIGLLSKEQVGKRRVFSLTNGQPQTQFSMSIIGLTSSSTVEKIIAQHQLKREFADKNEIIEIIGYDKKGKPLYQLHLDHLLTAVKESKVRTGYFNTRKGGKVSCPVHGKDGGDKDPSLHIFLDKLTFHCYGCGLHGAIALDSISEDQVHLLVSAKTSIQRRVSPYKYSKEDYPVIPKEHQLIMSRAQELLSSAFPGSAGEIYLISRAIDPDLAHQYGAGYGDDGLINGLLDLGYTFDDLIFYGFVGVSSKVSSLQGIVPLLRQRDLSLEEIKRETSSSKSGKSIWGFPYSVLNKRVTFLLTLAGKPDSFYGRSTDPACRKDLLHRKLTIEHTGVPQGGFNMKVLESEYDEVISTEAAIDTLSLIQMGYPNALGVIGTGNILIVREIVFSEKKNVAIALDNDKGGKETTPRFIKCLQEEGFGGEVRDFTEKFVAQNPDRPFKDWNNWLQIYGPQHNRVI